MCVCVCVCLSRPQMTGPLRLNPSADILLSLIVGIRREEERCHTHQTLNFPLSVGTVFYEQNENFARERERHRGTQRDKETGTDGDRVEGHRGEREAVKERGTVRTIEQ